MTKKFLKIGKIGLFEVKIPSIVLGSGQPKGLIVAMQHGGEAASLLVLKKIIKEQKKLKGTAIILPITNPFGQIFGQRNEAIEGRDLNRAFPGNPKSDFTARLANAIFRLCQEVDFVLDLHNFSRLSPVLAGFTKIKGKNQSQVLKMLISFNPEAIWETNPEKGEDERFRGILDETLTKIGKPSIFIEMPNILLVTEKQLEKVKGGIFNVFKKFDQGVDLNELKKIPRFSAKYMYSDSAGIFEPRVESMMKIKKNQVIGKVTLIPSFEEVLIKSPLKGTLLTIKPREVVRTGTKLCSFGM